MTSPEGPVLSVEKASLMKAEFEEWGTKTTIGVIAGMLYGGCKEAMRSAGIEQALLLKHSATENFRQRRWLFREIMEQKVLRVARGTVSGGAKLGLFTALFCGVQHSLAVERSKHDTVNVAVAGMVTAATFGLLLPGSFMWRLRTALIGSALGATLGVPLGFLQSTIHEHLNNDETEAVQSTSEAGKDDTIQHDVVGDAIQRLEDRLSGK
eukprot:c24040_g1_i2 orf=354-983(+)